MNTDRGQTHNKIRPINRLNPPYIRQMLHVPRYHNIQTIENSNGYMHRIITETGRDCPIG